MPSFSMASSAFAQRLKSETPASELVVAPAGYSFTPCTNPLAFAKAISSAVVLSVKYKVINGSKFKPTGRALKIRARYSLANAVVVIGGRKFGITIARANCLAVSGNTALSAAPSLKCTCQSSGRVMVILLVIFLVNYFITSFCFKKLSTKRSTFFTSCTA